MSSRPYAAARRTLTLGEKMLEVNWGLVLLIAVVACIGLAMQYSVAGGHLQPWAQPQGIRFIVGLAILVGVSLTDIRFWMRAAYPA